VFAVVLVCIVGVSVGSATAQETVEVSNIEDLRGVSDALGGNYVLTEDIDGSGAEGFEPIGNEEERFTGTFDGDGHVISGLTVNRTDEEYVGLFGYVGSEGTVQKLGLENVEVHGGDEVGGLAGRNEGVVRRSHVTGTVEGNDNVGGLVGRNVGDITQSYANVDVTGKDNVGGIAGRSVGSITKSYAKGTATGEEDVGGAVGSNTGEVANSYARVNVEGSLTVGGLIGSNIGGTVRRTYTTGDVSTAMSSGGFVGRNTGEITGSYWNPEAAGQAGSDGGIALTTDGMTGSAAIRNMDAFNFGEMWENDDNGYPVLAWEVHGYGNNRQSDMFLPTDGGEGEDEVGVNQTEDDEQQDDYQPPGQPGFGVFVALVALIGGAVMKRRSEG